MYFEKQKRVRKTVLSQGEEEACDYTHIDCIRGVNNTFTYDMSV